MHVIHFSRSVQHLHSDGGLERAVVSLTQTLRQQGVSCDVVAVPPLGLDRIDAEFLPTLTNLAPQTILHAHDWYGAAAVQACFRAGYRYIVTTAHLPVRRGFTYLDTDAAWQTKAEMEDSLFNMSSRIIAPSDFVRTYLLQEYGIASEKVHVIPHGVDADRFKPEVPYVSDETPPRLLFVGRVTEQKGVELLIRAVPIVRTSMNATLTVIGSGDRVEACQALARALSLDQVVTFVPHSNDEVLANTYAQSALLIMPSLFEPFGLVGLEAMACGCPVLSIAPTGASYLTEDDITLHHSPARLAGAIVRKLSEPQPRSGNRSKASSYTWANTASRTLAVYKALIQ